MVRKPLQWLLMPVVVLATAAATRHDGQLLQAVKQADPAAVRTLLDAGADARATDPDGTTALHWAVLREELEIVDLLVRAGSNVNAPNALGIRPLAVAALTANASVVERLLIAGADPHATTGDGETPLMIAARSGSVEVVRHLIAHGADVDATTNGGQTGLMWAAAEGHTAVVKTLLGSGADLRARSDVDQTPPRGMTTAAPAAPPAADTRGGAAARPQRPLLDVTASPPIRLPRNGGFTPLLFAVRQGHLDTVRALIEAGADPDETLPDGTSALVLATMNGHFELGVRLLDAGADPNADAQGWTALHTLTWVRRPNFGFNPPGPLTHGAVDSLTFARTLVARGANVNARMTKEPTNGYRNALNRIGATPLLMAARLADAPLMRVLMELGADPTITTDDESTVLMVAAGVGIHSVGEDPGTEEEALECVKLALELGGDPNAVDLNGETALHGAAYRGANSIVELLVKHGAGTFDRQNAYGWTPLRIAEGVFRTATYKESPHTAALLRTLMAQRQASAAPGPAGAR